MVYRVFKELPAFQEQQAFKVFKDLLKLLDLLAWPVHKEKTVRMVRTESTEKTERLAEQDHQVCLFYLLFKSAGLPGGMVACKMVIYIWLNSIKYAYQWGKLNTIYLFS